MKLYEYLIKEKGYYPDEAAACNTAYYLDRPLSYKWHCDIMDYWDYRESIYYSHFVENYYGCNDV